MINLNFFPLCLSLFVFLANICGILFFSHLFSIDLHFFYIPIGLMILGICVAIILILKEKNYWILPVIYGLYIFYFSNQSFKEIKNVKSGDYFHPVEFFSLGILISIAFLESKKKLEKIDFFKIFCIGVGYGIFDEIHQYFIPNRCTSFFDLFLDSVGISVALIFVHFLTKTNKKEV